MHQPLVALVLAAILSACQTGQAPIGHDVSAPIPDGRTLVFGTYDVQVDGRTMRPYRSADCTFGQPVDFLRQIEIGARAGSECGLGPQLVYLIDLVTDEVFVQRTDSAGGFFVVVPDGVYALIGAGIGPIPYYDPRFGIDGFLFATEGHRIAYVGTRRLMLGTTSEPLAYDFVARGVPLSNVSADSIQRHTEGYRMLFEANPELATSGFGMPTIHPMPVTMEWTLRWGWSSLQPYRDRARAAAIRLDMLPGS